MKLEELLREQPLKNSKHDKIIKQVENTMIVVPNVYEGFKSAGYKIPDKSYRGGFSESDIDLLMMQDKGHKNHFYWTYKEIPFNNRKLLVYEMKSNGSARNLIKAEHQLIHHYSTLTKHTDYTDIELFVVFGVGNGYLMSWFNKDKGDLERRKTR